MRHLLTLILLTITVISNAQVFSGSAAGINLGVNYALRHNLFIGVAAGKDYTMSNIHAYSATDIYLMIGYGQSKKKQFVSGGLFLGKTLIPSNPNITQNLENLKAAYVNNSVIGIPAQRVGSFKTMFGIKADYNYKLKEYMAISAGLGLKYRSEDYEYTRSTYSPNTGWSSRKESKSISYFLPTLNLGINFLL